jgi:hypothetical protein
MSQGIRVTDQVLWRKGSPSGYIPTISMKINQKLTIPTAQTTQTQPNGEGAAMSTESGSVVAFDSANVYKVRTHPPHSIKNTH